MKEGHDMDLNHLPEPVKLHIEKLETMRRDFVADVSHELRTPLTVIHGYLEMLCSKDYDSQLKKIFQQMYQHSLRMGNVIEDLLLLSRLETIPEEAEAAQKILVAKVLHELRDALLPMSADKQHNVILEVDAELLLVGYLDELNSLFSNLMSNAIKYTPARGEITIKWYQKGTYAIFEVTDTGIGIAQQDIPRLTERFYRVDKARSRVSGGTGLGLAIVKHVLLRHNGELEIDSVLGEGSTFRCLFPQ